MRSGRRQVYPLVPDFIEAFVLPNSIGAYMLYIRVRGKLRPVYAGRSDTDLRRRLLTHHRRQRATHFEYRVVTTSERAFTLECAAYHGTTGLLNLVHPARPAGTVLQCQFCSVDAIKAMHNRLVASSRCVS